MSIKNFKPIRNSPYNQGYYKCKNPQKYIGDLKKIIYRSSLELKAYTEFDLDDTVVRWSVEPPQLKISYLYVVDGKRHSYNPDAYIEKINKNGFLNKFVIEIKPKSLLIKPNKPIVADRKKYVAYKKRLAFWLKIMNKKMAAEKFCESKGMKYIFMTESYINRNL